MAGADRDGFSPRPPLSFLPSLGFFCLADRNVLAAKCVHARCGGSVDGVCCFPRRERSTDGESPPISATETNAGNAQGLATQGGWCTVLSDTSRNARSIRKSYGS